MADEDIIETLKWIDELHFHVDHEKRRVASSDQSIHLIPRGISRKPDVEYFLLMWAGRKIGIKTIKTYPTSDSVHWEIRKIGERDFHGHEYLEYAFTSHKEMQIAGHLALKALSQYGDYLKFHAASPELSFKTITATFSTELAKHLLGQKH